MASGGTYRINDTEFPAPEDTQWSEQEIAGGLNGIPINTGYKLHTWNFVNMEPCDYENLAAFFDTQQSGNTQLSEMETDVYNANLAGESYQTFTYTDFIMQRLDPRTRGLPLYDSVSVVFEIFVS